jgi:hypothetical protein
MVGPLLRLFVLPIDFCSHSLLFPGKNDVAKILGPFNAWKVPESQKHAKTRKICFAVLKPNEKDCLENP